MTGQKKLGSVVVIGMALFAMFFGAGNLIFPPFLGFHAGETWEVGFLAFAMVDVGMACVAVLAMTKGDGTISSVTGLIGGKMSVFINTAIIVCIGPLLAIPRTAATTFEMAVLPVLPDLSSYKFAFYLLFFLVAFLLAVRESKVVDIVGKVLTPVMVVLLAILILKGILTPIGQIQEGMDAATVAQDGIVAGYQTMDTLASLAFAIIVISSANERGFVERKERNQIMVGSCLTAGVLLAAVYGGLTYLGATASGQFDTEITQAQLLMGIIRRILGYHGTLLLGLVVALACMTTAIGLISSAASYFEKLLGERVSYRILVAVVTVCSFVIANFGLAAIIQIASPILNLLYPVVVTLILCAFLSPDMRRSVLPKAASLAAFVVSLCTVLESFGVPVPLLERLPLYRMGLAWLIPAVVVGFISFCIQKVKKAV